MRLSDLFTDLSYVLVVPILTSMGWTVLLLPPLLNLLGVVIMMMGFGQASGFATASIRPGSALPEMSIVNLIELAARYRRAWSTRNPRRWAKPAPETVGSGPGGPDFACRAGYFDSDFAPGFGAST